MTLQKHSILFREIEKLHGGKPWGSVLDAGSGVNSINWVRSLKSDRWTAVTGSPAEAASIQKAVEGYIRPNDCIKLGNWASKELLAGQAFDTVLADYLLGAVDGYAPYFQPYLFARLRPLVKQHLYVTGLEPYVPGDCPETEPGRLLWEIGRFRDSCLLLKGAMPYREYPALWITDHIERAGFTVHSLKHFNISYKHSFVNSQINLSLHGIDTLADQALAKSLVNRGENLRAVALTYLKENGGIKAGRNYMIAATPRAVR